MLRACIKFGILCVFVDLDTARYPKTDAGRGWAGSCAIRLAFGVCVRDSYQLQNCIEWEAPPPDQRAFWVYTTGQEWLAVLSNVASDVQSSLCGGKEFR